MIEDRPTDWIVGLNGYELIREIGSGGMGVVFRARDLELNRDVAVKVLRKRFAPDSGVAGRFVEEAQITGQLQHPGIPAVYRIGRLGDGRPYLAMKLIRGETLEELLKAKSAINILAIFEAICQALGYAHANLVLHRDLKPANIMVGSHGEVQVMDWGLAKVLRPGAAREVLQADPEATLAPPAIRSQRDSDGNFTQAGSVLGTPSFIPPEQAAGELEKVDSRSDVFGLGAILCVMLTGFPPYEGTGADSVRLNAVRGNMEPALARLDACGAEPEVVALCKQCLKFEPGERPADGNELARRIAALRTAADDRAKQAELAQARAEVQSGEQTKRRRTVLWASGLATGLLLCGIVGTGIGLYRASEESVRANEARKRAEEQTALALGVKNFLQEDVLQLANPSRQYAEQAAGGELKYEADLKLREVVIRAAKSIDGKFADQPEIEEELRWTLGVTLLAMGEGQLATAQCERVLELREKLFGPEHLKSLECRIKLANCYWNIRNDRECIKLRRETTEICTRVLGADHEYTCQIKTQLADYYMQTGKHIESASLFQEVYEVQVAKYGADSTQSLKAREGIANALRSQGKSEEALAIFEDIVPRWIEKQGPDNPSSLWMRMRLADAYASNKRYEDAIPLMKANLTAMKSKLSPGHPHTLLGQTRLGITYNDMKMFDEAIPILEDAVRLSLAGPGPDNPDTLWRQSHLAMSLLGVGRDEEGVKLLEGCMFRRNKIFGAVVGPAFWNRGVLFRAYIKVNRHGDAFALAVETLTELLKKHGPDHAEVANWTGLTLTAAEKVADPKAALAKMEPLILEIDTQAAKMRESNFAEDLFGLRHRCQRLANDIVGARETCRRWEGLKRTHKWDLYFAASLRAATAGLLKDKPGEFEAEASLAESALRAAVDAGCEIKNRIPKDKHFDAIRARSEFRAILASSPR